MTDHFSRRDALRAVISAGTMALVRPVSAAFPGTPLSILSTPIELSISTVSPRTVRIGVLPIRDGKSVGVDVDGALTRQQWSPPVAQIRSLSAARTVLCGELAASISVHPLTIRVERSNRELVQELVIDESSGELGFSLGGGLLLGLGQGGPQFDRRAQMIR